MKLETLAPTGITIFKISEHGCFFFFSPCKNRFSFFFFFEAKETDRCCINVYHHVLLLNIKVSSASVCPMPTLDCECPACDVGMMRSAKAALCSFFFFFSSSPLLFLLLQANVVGAHPPHPSPPPTFTCAGGCTRVYVPVFAPTAPYTQKRHSRILKKKKKTDIAHTVHK